MIKLIASDMDGTMLRDDKYLNPEIFPVIKQLYQKGILFAPASARHISSLERLFAPVMEEIYLIAENGACVWHGGKDIICDPMDKDLVLGIVKACKEIPGVGILAEARDCLLYTSENT